MHGLVIEVERYDKRIGTTQDTEDLWCELTTVHSTFQRKVNKCQELVRSLNNFKNFKDCELLLITFKVLFHQI